MRTLAIVAAIGVFGGGCADLVIKVNKKSKNSELASTSESEKTGAATNAEDFLKDMDNLRAVAFDMLMKQIKGKDFQSAVRSSIREFRSHLIKEAAKPRDPSLLSFDQSALKCHNDRLSLDYDQAHKYLGVILKSAVLAKLSEQSSKALNAQLSADAAAIAQLVLNEIGLKVEGDSQITRDGEIVTTKGDFKLSLVPFQDESAELQERDAKESISMSFVRVAGEGNDGSFSATISASELDANKQVRTYEMKVAVSREKAQGKMLYKSSMSVGHKGSDPHLKRMLVIEEIEAKKYRVLDEVSSGDVTKQSAFMIDIKALSECVIQKDKVKDDDKDKLKDKDQPKGDEPKKDEPKNDDKKDEPKKPVPVSDDDDVHTINKPGQNPGQSPTQK